MTNSSTQAAPRSPMGKVAIASFIGALLEWYDFFIFGTAAAIAFGPIFFSNAGKLNGIMGSFAIFGVGFLARPLGGIVFGHIGDRIGRKASLIATLVIIGLGTFLIGVLPTYAQIGIGAPMLLLALRLVQGFGLGGEYAGAALMTIEHAPANRRGFWGGVPQSAASAGILLATGIFALLGGLSKDQFLQWGWRIPFLISGLFTFIGLFIRVSLMETPDFRAMLAKGKPQRTPLGALLRNHAGNTALATGARLAETISSNIINAFGIAYIVNDLGMNRSTGLHAMMVASLIGIFLCPLFGGLSDRFGRRSVYLAGAGFMALFSYPFFLLLGTKSVAIIWLAFILAYNLGPTLMFAVEATFFTELFSPGTRYTGLSLAYQISAIAGGFMPLIGTWLIKADGGQPWAIAAFLAGICVLSFICAAAAKRLAGQEEIAAQQRSEAWQASSR
ncbi:MULTISPECIES: MFS transporter [unclassified Acidocella]|uniref:MFS transporter n=1 Tax=unclassified Acidocella TaxID=2648610 RepID=UPI00118178C5|nr:MULTISPECIES: MFS transporter [unclassified Acidocella]WBO59469.1 MHS family MFS transporter [Acidocella sp. MX-AZ03]